MIEKIVNETINTDIRQVQNEIAPIGQRPALQITCDHDEWNWRLQICERCGITREDMLLLPHEGN